MIHKWSTANIYLHKEKKTLGTATINGNIPALQYTITKRSEI